MFEVSPSIDLPRKLPEKLRPVILSNPKQFNTTKTGVAASDNSASGRA